MFLLTGSINLETVFAQAPDLVGRSFHYLWFDADALTVICLLLFMGAMGKSAQFLLHTWLPDAMEGPTPVSALIHAATMVTAGVFMVARLSPLFELAPHAKAFVLVIGATTAMFAATVGLVQNDIKRVIAYSTCSQLGYMFVAMGSGAYSIGMFHLFTHGFFKALLFLGSSSVIIAMHHEQDMRNMGGLRHKIQFTFWMMVIGTLALTGVPGTAGYFSKDAIIEADDMLTGLAASYGFIMTVVATALTSFYSWRLIFMTFFGEPHDRHHHEAARESPLVMLVPPAVLAVGAIGAGWAFWPIFEGHGAEEFFRGSLMVASDNHVLEEMEHVSLAAKAAPSVMMVIGFLVALQFYIFRPDIPASLARDQGVLYRFLLNAWYFDWIYDKIFVRPAMWLGRLLWKGGDGFVIDGFGPDGVSARVLDVTRNVVRLQTGYLYHYAFAMLVASGGVQRDFPSPKTGATVAWQGSALNMWYSVKITVRCEHGIHSITVSHKAFAEIRGGIETTLQGDGFATEEGVVSDYWEFNTDGPGSVRSIATEGNCIGVIAGFPPKECQRKGQSLTSKRHPIIRPANKKQNGGRGLIFDRIDSHETVNVAPIWFAKHSDTSEGRYARPASSEESACQHLTDQPAGTLAPVGSATFK